MSSDFRAMRFGAASVGLTDERNEDVRPTESSSVMGTRKRGGRRSARQDQPTHCTYKKKCSTPLTEDERNDRLVHCELHRARARTAAQRSRDRKVSSRNLTPAS